MKDNPKFFPFFKDALGAIDGTHIKATPAGEDRPRYRDRKGDISQNVLAACNFDMEFVYVLAGWEGSAADSHLYNEARDRDYIIPDGKYLLGDAGFPGCDDCLVPYRNVRYHLREWEAAGLRFVTGSEYRTLTDQDLLDREPRRSSSICATHNFEIS